MHADAAWIEEKKKEFYGGMPEYAAERGATMGIIGDHSTEPDEQIMRENFMTRKTFLMEVGVISRMPTRQRMLIPDGRHIDYLICNRNDEIQERREVAIPYYIDGEGRTRSADTAELGEEETIEQREATWHKVTTWSDHIMVAYLCGTGPEPEVWKWPKRPLLTRGEKVTSQNGKTHGQTLANTSSVRRWREETWRKRGAYCLRSPTSY